MDTEGRHRSSTTLGTSSSSAMAAMGLGGSRTRRSFIKGVLAGAIGGASLGAGTAVALESGILRGNSSNNATLTWSDEFDGPSGAPPNPAIWSAVVNGAGNGNQELEYYIPSASARSEERRVGKECRSRW